MVSSTAARFPQLGDKVRRARASSLSAMNRVRETGIYATTRYSVRQAVRSIASREEVLLFESPEIAARDLQNVQLIPLIREHLVEGSITNANDPPTLRYLMRCANRLSHPGAAGFVLKDETGRPIHFLWIDNFDGFRLAEIQHNIEPSSSNAAMIFDCWTPTSDRGLGYYATAIRQAAADLRREGRAAWIFSGATNASSLRGILKAGFEYRFSFIRRTRFGHAVVTRQQGSAGIESKNFAEPYIAGVGDE
jgi:hypothetical protein